MKMTRLEWRYLQRIALDHPYFDTHKLPLTEKEAKAIVEANNRMTGKEFVDSVYAKLGMPRPEEKKERFVWLRNIGELFTVPPIRKIAIAVLVVLLMVVFFAATPTGRAIAESVIQYVVTLFDDGSLAMNQIDNETPLFLIDNEDETNEGNQLDNNDQFVYVSSFDDFIDATGKVPVTLPLPFKELYYTDEPDKDYFAFYSVYKTSTGRIMACQIWNADCIGSFTLTGYSVYDADKSIYYSVEKDGHIYCIKVMADSVFTLSSVGEFSLDELIDMMK